MQYCTQFSVRLSAYLSEIYCCSACYIFLQYFNTIQDWNDVYDKVNCVKITVVAPRFFTEHGKTAIAPIGNFKISSLAAVVNWGSNAGEAEIKD